MDKRNSMIREIEQELYKLDFGTIVVLHRILCGGKGKRGIRFGAGVQKENRRGTCKGRSA